MDLDAERALRLVDAVEHAPTREEARDRCARAWDFLLAQYHLLRERANGYPRNPIDGATWMEGLRLAQVCDRFADVVRDQANRAGEAQAAGLATAIACQVVGHYPEEIFPRVLRAAECHEALGEASRALGECAAIVADFRELELESLLDEREPLEDQGRVVLASLLRAIDAIERLDPRRVDAEHAALRARAAARLESIRSDTA